MFDFYKILCFQLEFPNFVQNPLMSQPSLNIKKKKSILISLLQQVIVSYYVWTNIFAMSRK